MIETSIDYESLTSSQRRTLANLESMRRDYHLEVFSGNAIGESAFRVNLASLQALVRKGLVDRTIMFDYVLNEEGEELARRAWEEIYGEEES